MTATPGLFAAPLVSQAPAAPGRFAPPVIVPVVAAPRRRPPSPAQVREQAGRTGRAAVVTVAVLGGAAAVSVAAIGYGAMTMADVRVSASGTVLAPLPAPVNALPPGAVITATPGSDVATGASRLLHPTLPEPAQLTVIGPVSAGVALTGYATRCVAGACEPGSIVVVTLAEIAGGPDSHTPVLAWLRDRVFGG